jgi:sigma-E factor negative regulatory protein RseB
VSHRALTTPSVTLVAGGLAAALMLAWALAGDAAAVRRPTTDPEALDLLRETATAARRTPYEGVQIRTTWNAAGATTSAVQVAHAPEAELVSLHGSSLGAQHESPAGDGAAPVPGGLAGFTPATLDLLARNYVVLRTGDDRLCGRTAQVVEARRIDGSTAGRFWIDAQTGLMLQRELLDHRGRTVSSAGFKEVQIAWPRARNAGISGTPGMATAPWQDRLVDGELVTLREQGWVLPAALPGGFALQEARRSTGRREPVLHLSYSDGLAALSVFIQRGTLNARRLAGWWRAGDEPGVYRRESRQRWAVWESRGYVYTVLTDAPQGTADAVIAGLPHGDPGFWGRLEQGLARLGSWVSP